MISNCYLVLLVASILVHKTKFRQGVTNFFEAGGTNGISWQYYNSSTSYFNIFTFSTMATKIYLLNSLLRFVFLKDVSSIDRTLFKCRRIFYKLGFAFLICAARKRLRTAQKMFVIEKVSNNLYYVHRLWPQLPRRTFRDVYLFIIPTVFFPAWA